MRIRVRHIGPSFVLLAAVSLLATVFVGVAPASAATPATIKVSVANNNAGTLKITGSHFAHKSSVLIEVDQNGAFSGDEEQFFTVTSDSHGNFSKTERVFVTAACLVGVFASDPTHNSNVVNLNTTGKGCTGAQIQAQACNPLCGYLLITGNGFTPGSAAEVDFSDFTTGEFLGSGDLTACGTLAPGPYPPAPAGHLGVSGTCTGGAFFNHAFCGRGGDLIQVSAVDIDTDYVVPAILVNPLC